MKVLVTAASKHGATAEIASVIGAVLETEKLDVDVLAPDDVTFVDCYDAVVLGSGVYAGHWLKPAKEFVERHEAALRERPVFVFSSGPVGAPPKETDEPAEQKSTVALVGAIDRRVFGGRITGSQLGSFEKLIIRIVKAPLADDRPWDDIAEWAKAIASYLAPRELERRVAPPVGTPVEVA
jgi:menaquinone-dependent protoporphyrinogen oxidase